MIELCTCLRSSAACRVRIALNLKALRYEPVPVHLLRDGGEQQLPGHLARSPPGLVPVLRSETGTFTRSLAIIEYLDEVHPAPALPPAQAADRARVRAIAQTIACDIHPLNNLRVLRYLTRELGASAPQTHAWYRHWVREGLAAVERLLAGDARTGEFCHGEAPTLADCCLVPQVFNARRFDCPLDEMPTIRRIVAAWEGLEAFRRAAPENQPDAE